MVKDVNIRTAEPGEFPDVRAFYWDVIDAVGDDSDSVGWKKDVYPAPDFLKDSIQNGELFIAVEDNTIVGAMVLNHEFNDSYNNFQWPVTAAQHEATGIHALAVRPSSRKKGYAKQLVQFAIDYARMHSQKVIRLDVLNGNRSAEQLYRSMGFQYRHTLPMFYEDTGWTDFDLYEYPLMQE